MPLKRLKASEPVLEVIRFQRFQEVVEKALNEALKTLSLEKLESCYPNIAKTMTGRKYLELAQKQVYEFWKNESMKEFGLIYQERDLEQKLTQLDKLIYDAQLLKYKHLDDNKIYPDKMTPEEIIESKLGSVKRQKIKDYESQLDILKTQNEEHTKNLKELITASQELIQNINSSVETHFKGVDSEAQDYELVNQNIKQLLSSLEEV